MAPPDASVRELAERHWNGEGDLVHAHHPVTPVNERAAEEIAPGVLTMISVASVNTIDTGDGLVMLDTGGVFDADRVYEQVRALAAGRTAALGRVLAPPRRPRLRHPAVRGRGGRAGLAGARRVRPRGAARPLRPLRAHPRLEPRDQHAPVRHPRGPSSRGRTQYRYPDVTYSDHLTFTRGDVTFELRHARGETDDATWTLVPELQVLHPGDLFIWAVPNAGNPQKVQRYVSDWATALREMAACEPEIMLAGHGLPIVGADRIRRR